ncbi:MAG: type II toxin-antitoxin system RelE/ParE family toxin [Xanthobacteraceae bacterium]|jgi:toxin ParE1/3/4
MAEAKRAALWSPEALDNRERIWDYYVRVAGRHTAERILREIAEVIALIEDHPFAGRARNEVRPDLRSFDANTHVVFYRVVNDAPEIVRVLDGRQDIEEKFMGRDG